MRQWFFDFTQEAVSPGEKRPEAGLRQARGRHSFRIMRQWLFHRCGRI